ncbi:hypothetical protein GOBAR_AA21158 [Gossypium barbadense]|uniref:Uncharacterized protein n=1 Tax=Gossypium barbadense TaxID=3634 RepID=A0A2P5X851_GOSBA|nr:hypothetical protein GOBAR_AA21158 [Gossypium barbadense]
MLSSRGKKAAVPNSKKRKGASSSLGPTAEIRHPFLQFPIGPQEELFQILQARPLEGSLPVEATLAFTLRSSWIWNALAPSAASYNPSHSKASALPPSLRYIIDLTYFIALAIQHQTEWHRKLVISIGPYVMRLGISSMLSMRMIKKRRGAYPPQYHLSQSTEEEAPEDITDDVPPHNEDLPS